MPGRTVINGPFRTFVGCNQSVPPQKGIGGGGGGVQWFGEGGLIWRCVGFRRHFLSQFNFEDLFVCKINFLFWFFHGHV